jgi:hypothetical protein
VPSDWAEAWSSHYSPVVSRRRGKATLDRQLLRVCHLSRANATGCSRRIPWLVNVSKCGEGVLRIEGKPYERGEWHVYASCREFYAITIQPSADGVSSRWRFRPGLRNAISELLCPSDDAEAERAITPSCAMSETGEIQGNPHPP